MNIRRATLVAFALSAILTISGLLVFLKYQKDGDMLSGVGQIISAIATSITLIWLLLTQYAQWIQITHQHSVLELQRQDLDLQRQSMAITNKSVAAQIYLTIINDAKNTLSRYCRSAIRIYNNSAKEEDRVNLQSVSFDSIVEIFSENGHLNHFIKTHNHDPMISYIRSSYCKLYKEIKNYAESSGLEIGLFNLTMENSAYEHVHTIMMDD